MPANRFLEGGGEMATLTRKFNWGGTKLGPPANWPQSLKTTLSIILNSRFPMFLWWGPELICFYNDAYRPSLGQDGKHPSILGMPAIDAWPEIWDIIKPLIDQVLSGSGSTWSEDQLIPIYRNGKIEDVYWTFSYSPVYDESGKPAGVLVICNETTAKIKALKVINESKEDLEFALNAANLGAWDLNPITNKFKGNRRLKEWFGLASDEEIPLPLAISIIVEKDRLRVAEAIQKALLFGWGGNYDEEYTIINPKTGKERLVRAVGKALFDGESIAYRFSGTLEDITESKIAEEVRLQLLNSLKNNEQRLSQIMNQLPAHVLVINGNKLIVETANEAVFNFWNRKKEEVIGKPLLEILPELVGQPFPAQLKEVLELGKTIEMKESLVMFNTPDGGIKNTYVDYSYQPLTDASGSTTGVLVMSFEVTDKVESRKLLEKYAEDLQSINEEVAATNEELVTTNEELADMQRNLRHIVNDLANSEARFRTMVKQAPVAIAVIAGKDLIFESVNDEMLKLLGKPYDIIGKPYIVALPEMKEQPYLKILEDVFISGISHHENEAYAFLEHSGKMVEGYYNYVYQPITDSNGSTTAVMAVAINVTEQVISRKSIELAEEKLRMAVEAADLGSWYINIETREFKANDRLKKMFGYYPEEDMTYEQAAAQIPEYYRESVLNSIETAIVTGGIHDSEHTIIGYHDKKVRWIRAVGRLYKNEQDKSSNFSGIMFDITERKEDEQRKNDFIGMVSHELKTPLTSLKGYVQILHAKARQQDDNFALGALGKVEKQVNKMSTMINGFLNVSRLEAGKILLNKQEFDVAALIKEVIDETILITQSHKITLEPCVPIILAADLNKIEHVISNLLSNAIKYSPRDSTIKVRCERINKMVQVSVHDDGIGIQPHDAERLFERYYRVENNETKHISGFGIGLYLSAEIIERHGGKIWVESEFEKDSTFYFTLPVL